MIEHNIPTPPRPQPKTKLGRLLSQDSLFTAFIGALPTAFVAFMGGTAYGQFRQGNTSAGSLLCVAAVGGVLWAWAEWRARSAYDVGCEKGMEVTRAAALAVILEDFVPKPPEVPEQRPGGGAE